jgi:hypothetical protein
MSADAIAQASTSEAYVAASERSMQIFGAIGVEVRDEEPLR